MTIDDCNDPDRPEQRPPLTPRDADELLGAYVIGAIDDDERAAFEHHLETDPAARRESARLRAAFEELVVAEAVTPPATLWNHIASALPPRDITVALPAPERALGTDELTQRRTARAARRGGPVRIIAIASVAAAVVLIAGIAMGRVSSSSGGGDLATQLRSTATHVAGEAGARQVVLSGSGGTARVTVDRDGLAIVDTALPTLTDGRSYQLWATDSTAPVSLGLLGSTSTVTAVHLGTARRLAITVEPGTGSTQPTSSAIVAGQLT